MNIVATYHVEKGQTTNSKRAFRSMQHQPPIHPQPPSRKMNCTNNNQTLKEKVQRGRPPTPSERFVRCTIHPAVDEKGRTNGTEKLKKRHQLHQNPRPPLHQKQQSTEIFTKRKDNQGCVSSSQQQRKVQ
jgi:hypothetical protein